MKFITEEALRELYRKKPFTVYHLQTGERLTPGGRQFLLDKGIRPEEGSPEVKKALQEGEQRPVSHNGERRLLCRMKALQYRFLLASEALLKKDVCMSMQLTKLYKQFAAWRSSVPGRCEMPDMACHACHGMNEENFSDNLGDCFEITEFHMQLEKGREILLLASLRSELEELLTDIEDLIEDTALRDQLSARFNQMINTLSQMICGAMGGKECQRSI